jgi:AcrR family transcriptional regulator
MPPRAHLSTDESDDSMASTRLSLILAGERLFGDRGFTAVTFREINEAAGMRNTSAILYHFGSREGLISAILSRRFRAVDERRAVHLARIEGGAFDMRTLVEALILPLAAELHPRSEGNHYLRFLERAVRDFPDRTVIPPDRRDSWARIRNRIAGLLSDLPRLVVDTRLMLARALIVSGLADIELLVDRDGLTPEAINDRISVLIDATTALLDHPRLASVTV